MKNESDKVYFGNRLSAILNSIKCMSYFLSFSLASSLFNFRIVSPLNFNIPSPLSVSASKEKNSPQKVISTFVLGLSFFFFLVFPYIRLLPISFSFPPLPLFPPPHFSLTCPQISIFIFTYQQSFCGQ